MRYFQVIIVVGLLCCSHCYCADAPRVVRLMPEKNSRDWRMSVNSSVTNSVVADKDLTNVLGRLSLHHGDLILFGGFPRAMESSKKLATWTWLSRTCDSNQVAAYSYGWYPSDAAAKKIFTAPVFHWVAPFNDPRTMNTASFYCDGRFLGDALGGFEKVLDELRRSRPKQAFILGSAYDQAANFEPMARPHEGEKKSLDAVQAETGTELIELWTIPWF